MHRAAVITLSAAAVVACSPTRRKTPSPAERAVAEFHGAYPDAASPSGVVRSFELAAAPAELSLLDGAPLRVWAYNGQVPGPVLRLRLGDTLRVHFRNRLPQETTIHWHGVRVPNGMDGVPHLTQPPVPPDGEFTYEFTPKDAGTFWYHPHVRSSEQVERGLYGVLIVEDAEPPPYTQDILWVLDDWRLDETRQIDPRFNTRHDLAHDGRWGNAITVNGSSNEILRVRPGERIRLRLLNSANGRIFAPDFGALNAEIIAVDGLYLREPVPAKGFELAPGNRLDVDFRFDQSVGDTVLIADRFHASRPNRIAEIRVAGETIDAPVFPSPARARVPRWEHTSDIPVAHTFRLNAEAGGRFGIAWTIDGRAFQGHEHEHPVSVELQRDQFYRVGFVNESARLHPMHIHGMFFRLLTRNGVPADEPFFRDTVLVHPREHIEIGVVPTDVGQWMLHCHILEHAEAGMMTTIRVHGESPR